MTKFSTAQEPVDPSPPTGVDPVRILAGVLAAGSVVFTGWKIWDLIAGPSAGILIHGVGVASGLAVESAWLMLLALAHQQATRTGHVSRWVTIAGWILAIGAAGILLAHGVQSGAWVMALLGMLPLMAKTAWHGLTHTRALETLDRNQAAEQARSQAEQIEREREREAARAEAARLERERALSTDPTDDDEREIAELHRRANVARLRAEAERELTTAEAEAERMREQAQAEAERIRREAESQLRREAIWHKTEEELAVLESNAALFKRRSEVESELALTSPLRLGAGPHVPNDASGITGPGPDGPAGPVAGFGVPEQARAQGAHPADQHMPSVPTPGGGALSEAERNRRAVLDAYTRLSDGGTVVPTISAVADAAGVSRRTVNRHLPKP